MDNGLDCPLEGVRVLDLTHFIAGPYCTKLLADYGADVIKIERPDGGDPARRMGPFLDDEPHLEKSGLFLHLNTNKKSVTLNLKSEAGRDILLNLVRNADIVVESFAPRVLPSLRLDYPVLSDVNRGIVMTSISNYGQTGPYRDYRLSEITMYALGGSMQSTGLADREPVKLGLTVEQFYAGALCAGATMGAFMGTVLGGEGQHLDLSLFEISAGNQDRATQAHTNYQYTGVIPPRRGGDYGTTLVPSGVFPCADGHVQFFTTQPLWDRICRMIERPDLIADPYFTAPDHFNNNPEVKAEFEVLLLEWLLPRTKREVTERAQAVGYPCGALNTMADVFGDPHLQARGFLHRVDHPVAGTLTYPGAPFQMSEGAWKPGRAPLLGEHTTQVLTERLGYSAADVVRLREQGAI
jgi:crotonobetainyl-CoA:carnitine CoA-transferase CaiB-like acyl-CoA transferase